MRFLVNFRDVEVRMDAASLACTLDDSLAMEDRSGVHT